MSFRMPSGATASQTTKRREPRPRRAAIACGEPSPRLKPDGLARRRPATATPSGVGAVASARTPRVARTRTRGAPCVDGTKTLRGFSRTMTLCEWPIHQSRGHPTRRHGDTESRHDVRIGSSSTNIFQFFSVSPPLCVRHSMFLPKPTTLRAEGVSLFVDRREADPLSCRAEGARSCRRGRENPKGGEDAEAMPGENEVFSPGGASVASAAPRAVSRRRRFVFARSAAPLHERFIFINTERPAAGRREMTGSLASRMPVGFVARSLAGVWGEAPVQDSQTAGRKKSSLNARSASLATLPLPREAALCLKTKTCQ